jgi:hypothetical protein
MLRPYQDDFAGKRLSSGRKTGNAFVNTDDSAGKRLSDGRKTGGWVWNLKWLWWVGVRVADCVIEM